MIAFRDRTGRLWTGRLDTAAAIRMRDLAGEDVMELGLASQAALEFGASPSRLANAAYAIMLPQCEQRGVSDREFGQALPGRRMFRRAVPVEMSEAILAGIIAFFTPPKMLPGEPPSRSHREKLTADRLWCYLWANASVAGIDPLPFTFGELAALADAKRKHDWSQTARVLSFLAGIGGKKLSAADLDPTGGLRGTNTQKLELTPQTFGLFASVLMRGKN